MMTESSSSRNRLPSRLVVVAGTYDGVLAGWDTVIHEKADDDDDDNDEGKKKNMSDGDYLKMSFAQAAHEGSVRCLSIASAHMNPPPSSSSPHDNNDETNNDDANTKKRKRKKKKKNNNTEEQQAITKQIIEPGAMLSGGYDESIRVFNLHKHAEAGDFRTPSNLGTPTCSSFAPPSSFCSLLPSSPPLMMSTHALVGLTSGKILLYRKKDWSIQHILSGHSLEKGGVNCLAVHPSGKMALSGGKGDGRIVLWDLTKGRLAFVHKLTPLVDKRKRGGGGTREDAINCITWSEDGNRYAFCRGNRVTVRDIDSGSSSKEDVLDVDLPSKANQITFVGGKEGMFLAVACEDGSLPVLGVGNIGGDDDDEEENYQGTRRAIMAIEPVERLVAGEERFKCIKAVAGGSGFLVVTANSGGVISLMDLEGAARMMLADDDDGGNDDDDDDDEAKNKKRSKERDEENEDYSSSEEEEDEDEEDVAVEILESVRVGTGARITNIAVWSYDDPSSKPLDDDDDDLDHVNDDDDAVNEEETSEEEVEPEEEEEQEEKNNVKKGTKRKIPTGGRGQEIEMDSEALAKARELVSQAKKREKKQNKKKNNKKKKQKTNE